MIRTDLYPEEKLGLALAGALHLALVGVLAFGPLTSAPTPSPAPMSVSLVSEAALQSRAREPVAEAREAISEQLSEKLGSPDEGEREAQDAARPEPSVNETPDPAAQQDNAPRRRPDQPRSANRKATAKPGGASRVGEDFLEGAGSDAQSDERRVPAERIGASERASIQQALIRQIRPHWQAPAGIDAEKLVTILSFELDEDGNLKGRPRVVGQSGITPSNRPQAALHAERAVRAVQLAAPFDLPSEYYEVWKVIRAARFDRNLSR